MMGGMRSHSVMGEGRSYLRQGCVSQSDMVNALICVNGLLACLSAKCSTNYIKIDQRYKEGERFFYFGGDEDDCLTLVDSWVKPDNKIKNLNSQRDAYWFFTRKNPNTARYLEFNNVIKFLEINYDYTKPTIIVAHGWLSGANSPFANLTRDAFLQNEDVNVILINWRKIASEVYPTSVHAVPKVGVAVGELIKWLVSLGASYSNIHLVGHNLGSHVVALAGRATGGQVRRITALDPAGPLFYSNENRLKKTDAEYVEVIHTNSFVLGYPFVLGHVDHYPNGGIVIPGCGTSPLCAHKRSYELFASSVMEDRLMAKQCDTDENIVADQCNGQEFSLGNSDLNKNGEGIYRINTKPDFPYF